MLSEVNIVKVASIEVTTIHVYRAVKKLYQDNSINGHLKEYI